LPVGGEDELQRLVIEDAVLNVHGPVALGAVGEFLVGVRDGP
jgi:hypothetical protein